MPKPYPERIALKHTHCPECKKPWDGTRLAAEDISVSFLCANQGCRYQTELFWIGDKKPWMN